jgi:hypothetical protein
LKFFSITAGVVYAFGGALLTPLAAQTPLNPGSQIPVTQIPESQNEDAQAPPDDASTSPAPFAPLTLGQNYLFTLNKVFGPGSMFLYSFHAGLQTLLHKDNPWGTTEDDYTIRAASLLGRSFLRQNLAFGVRAFDHEDPRYFALGHGGGWTRVKYAVLRTFLVRNDSGGTMPAYSLLLAAYGTPLLADRWGVEHFLNPHPFRAGTAALGFAVGSDVFQEFWPDLRRKLDLDGWLHRRQSH